MAVLKGRDALPFLRRAARAVAVVGMLLSASGCGAATQNVRAYRAFANEDPNVKVSIDRVEDLAVTLQLVDRILLQTSYTPGDMWPRRLGMTDAQFREVKAQLREKYPYKGLENAEVPVLKCYRIHLENTLADEPTSLPGRSGDVLGGSRQGTGVATGEQESRERGVHERPIFLFRRKARRTSTGRHEAQRRELDTR